MAAEDGLAFGMLASGRMVGVKEVANGINCACVCPSCGAPLVARQGKIRTWHFSHAPGHEACGGGAESALHRMAKQIIAGWDVLELPQREVRVARTVCGRDLVRASTLSGYRFEIRASSVEQQWHGLTPDVLLHGAGEEMLAVEVCVTHYVEERKRARVIELNLPMVEYDLSALSTEVWDAASLNTALRTIVPDWIAHPLEASVRQRLEDEILQDEADLLREVEDQRARSVVDENAAPALPSYPLETINQPLVSPSARAPGAPRFEWNGVAIVINLAATAAVWVCTGDLKIQAQMLAHLETDAKALDLHIDHVVRTRGHGVLIASGTGARGWAETLEARLAGAFPTDFQPVEDFT